MSPRKSRGIAGDKTICLPIEEGVQYEDLVQKPKEYRAYLDKMREKYPEILVHLSLVCKVNRFSAG